MKIIERLLLGITVALLSLGLTLVLSASAVYSNLKFDSFYYLFNSHLMKVAIAVVVLIAFWMIPYTLYKKYSKLAMLIAILALIVTLFTASQIKGAGRWLDLGLFSFQPSEAAKILLIIHLAVLIEKKKLTDKFGSYKLGFLIPFMWVSITAALVFIQPNVSNAMIIMTVGIMMLYIAGAKLGHIVSSVAPIAILGVGAALIYPHSRERLIAYYQSFVSGGEINTQVMQAKIGLGSGGFNGLGMGESRQSDLFLPESYGDFIFSILGEEHGFIGAFAILFAYFAIFVLGVIIAKKTRDEYGQLLAFGISFTIVLSAFINSGVVMGIFPTTGIPLPLISFGGTSIIFLTASIGILLNIARSAVKIKEGRSRR